MIIDFYEELYRRRSISADGLGELYRIAMARVKSERLSGRSHEALPFASSVWTCRDSDGRELWVRTAENLWTTVGSTWLLGNALTGGSATPTYLGLIAGATAPVYAITDTATSHPGWSEVPSANITATVRQTLTWGSPSGGVVNNSSSQITYQMSASLIGSVTLWGGFMIDNNTLNGTSGSLISEATFDQGSASVAANNTITALVTVTILAG